jgi:hypothetical protein
MRHRSYHYLTPASAARCIIASISSSVISWVLLPPLSYCITTVSVSPKKSIVPSHTIFQSGPSCSLRDGTSIITCLANHSVSPCNTRHTCSSVPLPGWPRDLLNLMRYLSIKLQVEPVFLVQMENQLVGALNLKIANGLSIPIFVGPLCLARL